MRAISANDYQKILLNIFKSFRKYCEENEIRIFLCYGTAIGAVRHQGFIPWDDDIDLYVFRDGFSKLMALARENPYIDDEKRYKILMPGKFPCVYPFFKVVDTKTVVYERNIAQKYATGAWIDVFCLSYWAEGQAAAAKQFKKQQFYKKMNKLMIGGNYRTAKYRRLELLAAPVRAVLQLMGMTSEYWCKKMLALDQYQSGTHMGNICWPNSFKQEYYEAAWFADAIDADFEDLTCKIAKDYDAVLTNFYGDYMTIPPENERTRHDPEAYYLN